MKADQAAAELRSRVAGRVVEHAALGPLTTFRVGGPADVLVEAESEDDLRAVGEVVGVRLPVAVIGKGSNLLVSDDGFRGVAVRLGRAFRTHRPTPDGLVLGGAVYLPAAARLTARLGRTGFEFAAEIPATFGGAVRMNAGAHDRCIADVLTRARVVDLADGRARDATPDSLELAYRHSALGPSEVVCEGEVRLEPADPADVAARIGSYLRWRRTHQPPGRSAGSVFTNPPGDAAGRLIDSAGGKGMRVGGARISDVHANFIVVDADARAADVWELIDRTRRLVRDRAGVDLECEVRFLGEFRGRPTSGVG